jgi:hypothetical protein
VHGPFVQIAEYLRHLRLVQQQETVLIGVFGASRAESHHAQIGPVVGALPGFTARDSEHPAFRHA